jgi:hypothetical protein
MFRGPLRVSRLRVDTQASKARGNVKRAAGATITVDVQGCVEQLARFFPDALPVRIPVHVIALRGGASLRETAVLEFSGGRNAIFLSTLPLEFDDRVKLERDSPKDAAEATVIAVQYHDGCKAVAVRFNQGIGNW